MHKHTVKQKTKTVTNANATSKTNVDTEMIKGTSNKYITSNSSVLPQTSEKNGSSIPVIVVHYCSR